MDRTRTPRISVVVPIHQSRAFLPACLRALVESDLPRTEWELIVVDDASRDGGGELAAAHADRVIRTGDRARGPSYARNRGAELTRADILVFVDADVRVHRDALQRLDAALQAEPELGAVFGSYDASPPAPGLVSQYRNLAHHYVHLRNAGEIDTFWAGCGAVRRDVFEAAGGFDELRYPRPSIEDIELGYRIRALGRRIRLDPTIACAHLKRWTFRAMLVTDVRDRGVPWMRLLLEQGRLGSEKLNVDSREKQLALLAGITLLALLAIPLAGSTAAAVAVGSGAGVVLGNLQMLRWLAALRGTRFALSAIPLRFTYHLVSLAAASIGIALHIANLARAGADPATAPRAAPEPPGG